MGSMRSEILGFMKWGFSLLFSGMLILVGLILRDRRSTLKPVKDDIADLERRKVDRVIAAMKKLAEEDAKVAQVLRSVGLALERAVLEGPSSDLKRAENAICHGTGADSKK